ncbi:hypothetical protein Tco_0771801 [Tanacetum coccineum]|uniref:Uncharacterized protein n=1 Tax=Tanacetum coccineum TaxID=301880 RepID=A0ABQ4ZGZ6_9ASTR
MRWGENIVGIKSLLNAVSITAALIDVNAAQSKLVLLEESNENYSKCLRLLVKLQLPVQVTTTSGRVNAASEEAKEFDLLKVGFNKWYQSLLRSCDLEESVCVHKILLRRYGYLKFPCSNPAQRRLEVKARSTLMMGIPNEHQLKFNSIKDAKLLLEAVEKRFGGNVATKKTQRNLLKQQYENFTSPSSEMLDQTFDRLQKLVSQLERLDEKLSQEDVNQKLLRSLSPEWNTHAIIWRNKAELETMSMDDLNNNLKEGSLLLMAIRLLVLISPKWSATTATRGENFARECRAPRNQDYKNKESSRRNVSVETPTSTALVSCDGLGGYDWSDQAEEGPSYAIMAYSSSSSNSEVSNDSICYKSCLETVKLLKSQYDQLLKDFTKFELMVLGYKTGLESVEERLEFYKKNESIYEEKIKGLKWDIQVGEITIGVLRKKLEIVQKEKDGIQFNVDKFENAFKIPPPYTRNFMPPKPDLSFISLDDFVIEPVVENCKAKSSKEEPKVVRKNDDAPTIEEWVSDDEEKDMTQPKIKKKIVKPVLPR